MKIWTKTFKGKITTFVSTDTRLERDIATGRTHVTQVYKQNLWCSELIKMSYRCCQLFGRGATWHTQTHTDTDAVIQWSDKGRKRIFANGSLVTWLLPFPLSSFMSLSCRLLFCFFFSRLLILFSWRKQKAMTREVYSMQCGLSVWCSLIIFKEEGATHKEETEDVCVSVFGCYYSKPEATVRVTIEWRAASIDAPCK